MLPVTQPPSFSQPGFGAQLATFSYEVFSRTFLQTGSNSQEGIVRLLVQVGLFRLGSRNIRPPWWVTANALFA